MVSLLVSLLLVVGYALAGVGAIFLVVLAAFWADDLITSHLARVHRRVSARLFGLSVDRLLGGQS